VFLSPDVLPTAVLVFARGIGFGAGDARLRAPHQLSADRIAPHEASGFRVDHAVRNVILVVPGLFARVRIRKHVQLRNRLHHTAVRLALILDLLQRRDGEIGRALPARPLPTRPGCIPSVLVLLLALRTREKLTASDRKGVAL
jgi:hypothetical protein